MQEACHALKFRRWFAVHILVAQEHKTSVALPQEKPASDVIGPRSPLRIKLGIDKARDEIAHRIIVSNVSRFYVVVIEGDRDIPRVAHDIDDSPIMRLKTFMALEQTRLRQSAHRVIGVEINFGDAGFDVRKGDGIVAVEKVAEKKSRPGISRPRVGHEKDIVGIDGEVASGHLLAGEDACRLRDRASYPLPGVIRIVHDAQAIPRGGRYHSEKILPVARGATFKPNKTRLNFGLGKRTFASEKWSRASLNCC